MHTLPGHRRSLGALPRVAVLAWLALGAGPRFASWAAAPAAPSVVINEVFYHPAEDRDDLQFLELYNTGTQPVDLSGWALSKGVQFVFPQGTSLPAEGYVVVGRNITAFKAQHGSELNLAGAFTGRLSHKGERIELKDARGQVVDELEYTDRAPWAQGADGSGGSLERICPAAPGNNPANWAASPRPALDRPGATPGRRNSCYSAIPLPTVLEVRAEPGRPDQPIGVTATVMDRAGIESVVMAWAVWGEGVAEPWAEAPLPRTAGDARRGVYAGRIPPQPRDRLIRFTLRVKSADGAERLWPAATEPSPTFSAGTFVNTNTARVPFLRLLTLNGLERAKGSQRARTAVGRWGGSPSALTAPATGAAVYLPPGGGEAQLFDHVAIRPRKGGMKVHFHKDQPLKRMTGINVIFEASSRWLLSEPLSYELYRLAGVPAPATEHVRVWLDHRPLGYYLLIEQPNTAFLRRHERSDSGNLYKLIWYERGLIGQHEKKTRVSEGHADLVQVVEGLRRTAGAEQWDFIQQHFNVQEMIDYFAVNMCIQNWDGFWNNYFAYHDLRPGGKWELFPWDEDKTWGDFDGVSPEYDWYTMPLTFGMNGDRGGGWFNFGGGPFGGGSSWWRPPGWFSGPLLAHPEFRARFLARLGEVCRTAFTPEKMEPFIRELEHRLEDEVQVQARLHRRDPDEALRLLRHHIQTLRNQVVHRREFILKQLAAKP